MIDGRQLDVGSRRTLSAPVPSDHWLHVQRRLAARQSAGSHFASFGMRRRSGLSDVRNLAPFGIQRRKEVG